MRLFQNYKMAMGAMLMLLCAVVAQADSTFLIPSDGYRADDYLGDQSFEAFNMLDQDSALLCKAGDGLRIVELATGQLELDLGQVPGDYISSNINPNDGLLYLWASFVEKSPIDDTYWVGFTNDGDDDDRIYQVTSDGTWTHRATLMCNFDLKFSGSNMIVSANPGGITDALNQIVSLDTSGNDDHTVLANVGGYSAGLGVGVDGSVYYTTYIEMGSPDNKLLRFTDTQIQTALTGGGPCEAGDAEVLYDVLLGAYDTEVDASGHVVFNGNGPYPTPAQICLWDEAKPDELLEIAICTTGDWLTQLDVEGDLLLPGSSIYASTWGRGITKITKLIPGDANGDGMVDGSDVTILANNWQHGVNGTADATWSMGDFNADGVIDGSDVTILANNWQASLWGMSSTAATAVPEPNMVVLLAVLALMLGVFGDGKAFFYRLYRAGKIK